MKDANRLNANFALIIGDNELDNNIASLKNMDTGKQEDISLNNILNHF